MSTELCQSFHELKLSGRHGIIPATRAPPAPLGSSLATYPPLPDDYPESNRYYFFGWRIPDTWFTEFARLNVDGEWDPLNGYHCELYILRQIVGYGHIYSVLALPEGETPTNETDASTPTDCAISLSSTRSRNQYMRRPTEGQLKHLTQIMGCPPYWFKDGMMKKKYYQYDIRKA